jgi:hypothetical protein
MFYVITYCKHNKDHVYTCINLQYSRTRPNLIDYKLEITIKYHQSSKSTVYTTSQCSTKRGVSRKVRLHLAAKSKNCTWRSRGNSIKNFA